MGVGVLGLALAEDGVADWWGIYANEALFGECGDVVYAVDPVVKHYQYFHGVEALEYRFVLEVPPVRVFFQFFKKGLDVVVEMDVFQQSHTVHAISFLADVLEQCSDKQLYLSSDVLSQPFPAETNKIR